MAEKKIKPTVERLEEADSDVIKPVQTTDTMGTVTINDAKDIFLVTAPSADPRDPLNMPKWRKIVFIVLLSVFSSVGLALVSGFGGLLGFYIPIYVEHGASYADITALMTYPTMFMGLGNLIFMPLAMSIGRRPVYLMSCVILVAAAIGAAYVKNYDRHLAVRMILGFAAGQSEALVPMMIQEIHFLHERSTFLMWQSAIQTIISAVYVLFASPIAGAIGPGNWYNLGGGLAAAVLLASIFLVPETRYNRSLAAYGQATEEEVEANPALAAEARPVRLSERPAFDFDQYQPRTIWSDMRIVVGEADWWEGWYTFFHTFQILLFPNVLWAFCLNGLTLGVNIALGTTYGAIVTAPPYNWPESSASYVTPGQIVTALVALPLLGNGSDYVLKWRARRNGGVHEPENRLLLLWIPILIGVVSRVIYGQAAAHPERYHWFAIAWAYAAYYFAFIGANIAAITYLLDSYPARAAPVLVVITAMRGFVSFGTSYGVAKFIAREDYDGSFGAYAGLTAAHGLLGIPVFWYGKRIRQYTGRWATKKTSGRPSMAR
ncbi:Putative major facilitator superfamily, MFS transporter superfamily [Septoria linicola]|uniref:Major facilitator superfamily, MFS transporter superfamily n=1 Tax=Septoria linicola TaxID=215465 RepID=A0A9Q9AV66_9PEZI|nr:Putative major facilitator superfamily, MFS transporter superfamily [Septoria linicola]